MQLSTVDSSCRGPTDTSHWIIPEVLLSSGYPGAKDKDEHRRITRAIYESGLQVFVNLMQPKDLAHLTLYEPEIRQYAIQDGRNVEFLSFPIPDQHVCRDDQKVLELCLNLLERLTKNNQKIVVHCWGGHGRTSTIISILIGMLFQYEADDTMDYNYKLQQQRLRVKGRMSSIQPRQSEQVRTILNMYKDQLTSSAVSSVEQ